MLNSKPIYFLSKIFIMHIANAKKNPILFEKLLFIKSEKKYS